MVQDYIKAGRAFVVAMEEFNHQTVNILTLRMIKLSEIVLFIWIQLYQ